MRWMSNIAFGYLTVKRDMPGRDAWSVNGRFNGRVKRITEASRSPAKFQSAILYVYCGKIRQGRPRSFKHCTHKRYTGILQRIRASVDDTWRHLSEGSSQERVAVYLGQSVDADSEEALCWTRSGVLIGFAQPCK